MANTRWREHPLARAAFANTALLAARDSEELRAALDAGATIDATRSHQTVLHRACDRGDTDLAVAAIELGADIDANQPETPMKVATDAGHSELVRLLAERGAMPPSPERDSDDEEADVDDVRAELTLDELLFEACGDFDDPVTAVRALLDRGASASAADEYISALGLAASRGGGDTVKLLLERGADPNRVIDGDSVLAHADDAAILVLLIEAGAKPGKKFVLQAARAASLDLVRNAVEAGDTVDAVGESGDTPLLLAAEAGAVDLIDWLLDRKADISVADSDGRNALARAASGGHGDAVDRLLAAGVEVGSAHVDAAETARADLALRLLQAADDASARNESVRNVLHTAADAGHAEVIAAAIDRGVPIDKPDIIDNTPLSYAAWRGHYDCAQLLLAAGADPRASGEYSSETPLSRAIAAGNEAIALLLLENGAEVSGKLGDRAFVEAAGIGSLRLLEALVAAGADPTAAGDDSEGPVEKASRRGHRAIVEYLLDRGASPTSSKNAPLIAAAEGGRLEIVELLLERGGEADSAKFLLAAAEGGNRGVVAIAADRVDDIDGPRAYWDRTALMEAATGGHSEAVKLLLEHGADPNREDEEGQTALAMAYGGRVKRALVAGGAKAQARELVTLARDGRLEAVETLLAKDVNLDSRDDDGRTALMEAAAAGHRDIARALIAAGAKVDATDRDRWTALMEAAEYGDVETVEALLDAGANPFTKDDHGFIAYTIAGRAEHAAVLGLLEKRNADVDRSEELVEAVREGKAKKVAALLASGISADTRSEYGEPVIVAAASSGKLPIVRALLDAGADVNGHSDGDTALLAAAGDDNSKLVAELLERGADPTIRNEYGDTPLSRALEYEAKKAAALLIEAAEPTTELLDKLVSAELYALAEKLARAGAEINCARDASREFASKLLKKGVEVAVKPSSRALERAVECADVRVLRALTARDDCDLSSPELARIAAREGDRKTLTALIDGGAALAGCIATMAEWGSLTRPLLKQLIEAGDSIDAGDEHGMTALMYAARAGDLALVKMLHKAGADLDVASKYGGRALTEATEGGDDDVIDWLIATGASLSGRDASGWSPLMHVAKSGNLERVKALIDRGAETAGLLLGATASGKIALVRYALKLDDDVEQADEDRYTAAMHAAESGNIKVVNLLFERGADAAGTLFGAASSGKVAIAKRCIEQGADLDWANAAGMTPLMCAAGDHDRKMVALLLEHGAAVDRQDEDGETALMYGADDKGCVKALLAAGAQLGIRDKRGKTAHNRVNKWSDTADLLRP